MRLAPRALVHASLGQRPREKFPPKRALKARIKKVFAKRLQHCGIIAEKDAEVNRAVSAGEFLTKTWGVAPG
jgi:hypothetical protein